MADSEAEHHCVELLFRFPGEEIGVDELDLRLSVPQASLGHVDHLDRRIDQGQRPSSSAEQLGPEARSLSELHDVGLIESKCNERGARLLDLCRPSGVLCLSAVVAASLEEPVVVLLSPRRVVANLLGGDLAVLVRAAHGTRLRVVCGAPSDERPETFVAVNAAEVDQPKNRYQ